MFKVGEKVRKVGESQHGVIALSWPSIGSRRYRVVWEDGNTQICKPSDMREVKSARREP
jgi:hypothetical protein